MLNEVKPFIKKLYGNIPGFNVAAPASCESVLDVASQYDVFYQKTVSELANTKSAEKNLSEEFHKYFRSIHLEKFPEEFVVQIPNGRVHGFGTVLSPDGKCILSDASVSWKFYDGKRHSLLKRKMIRRPKRFPGTTAVAAVWGGWGYYHWLIEELPRLIMIEHSGVEYDRILSNAKQPQQLDALELIGLKTEIVQPTSELSFYSDNLVAPSFVGRPGFPSSSTISLLSLFKKLALEIEGRKGKDAIKQYPYIYISRNRSGRRFIDNESDVIKILEQYGFETIYLEELPFIKQISLFDNAEIIVAPHGAGLANLVFCNSGARVIELFNSRYVYSCFYQLASQKGLSYYAQIEDEARSVSLDRDRVGESINVNCSLLRKTIHNLVSL